LIDTILQNLPIPEIYIQIKTNKEGKTKYVVVDGQQRMRAILDFIAGEYALLEAESPEYKGKEFKDLTDGLKEEFWSYSIVTRELQTNNTEEVKEIFRRLNKYVVPLNEQELRNATYGGHFIGIINQIAEKDDFWAEHKIVTPTDIKRMLDAEFISELFIAMLNGIQQKDQESINGFYKQYDQNFTDKDDIRREFEATKKMIQKIFGDNFIKTRWHKKSDFYSLFITFRELLKTYHLPQDRYEEIKTCLIKFASEVDSKSKSDIDTRVKDYAENVNRRSTDKAAREKRYNIVRELMIPFLISKDIRRNFNDEERRIAWARSKDKKCVICGKVVDDWADYHLDHITPHSKGGKTELKNSQITHKSCNIKKSNKTSATLFDGF